MLYFVFTDCQQECLNGGFCNGGACECPEGFTGEYCQWLGKMADTCLHYYLITDLFTNDMGGWLS